jgi:hypothetical protein
LKVLLSDNEKGTEVRIVTWNCNMALHDKHEHLLALAPDIAILPECASIEIMREKAPDFLPSSSIWIGDNQHKGLGVFTFGAYRGERSDIYTDGSESSRIDASYNKS